MKLKNKTIIPYKGEVIDLNVSNSHTYNVENLAVHNSGGGSLVAYVLYITDLDPIEWDLPFARFLSVYRSGAPDIDCVNENHLILMGDGSYKRADELSVGDYVVGADGLNHKVTSTYVRDLRPGEGAYAIVVKADDGTLGWMDVVPKHKFITEDGEVVYADQLTPNTRLMSSCGVTIMEIHHDWMMAGQYVDITVEDDHRFHIVPFDVWNDSERGQISLQRVYSID